MVRAQIHISFTLVSKVWNCLCQFSCNLQIVNSNVCRSLILNLTQIVQ